MIDWTAPYMVSYKVYSVDEGTWDEKMELRWIDSLSINRDCTDAVPLLETSNMTVSTPVNSEFRDGWYRVVAYVTQGNHTEMIPLTTQWYELESDEIDYGKKAMTVNGRSVLLPASEQYMRNGDYIAKGINGAEWALRQLQKCVKAPVYLLGDGFVLDRYFVYDQGESVLSAVWHILDQAKWCLQIDGRGVIRIRKSPVLPTLSIGVDDEGLLFPTIKRSRGKKDVPNQYTAKDGEWEETVTNDDPSSPSSTVNVGRVIPADLDTAPSYIDGESLWSYVRRKLEELSTKVRTYSYTREYYPDIYPMDIINVYSARNGFVGNLRVSSQQISLGENIRVGETAAEEEKLWRA